MACHHNKTIAKRMKKEMKQKEYFEYFLLAIISLFSPIFVWALGGKLSVAIFAYFVTYMIGAKLFDYLMNDL